MCCTRLRVYRDQCEEGLKHDGSSRWKFSRDRATFVAKCIMRLSTSSFSVDQLMQRRSAALCDASSHVFPLAPSPSRSVTSGDPTGTGKYVWLFVESSRLIIFRKNHSWKNLFRHFYPFQFYLMEETTQYDEIRTHIDERVLLKKKSAKIFTSFNKWLVIQVKKNLSGNPTGGDDVYGFQMNAQRFHAITNTPSGRGLTGDTGR